MAGFAAAACATGQDRGGFAQVNGLNIEYSRRGYGQPTIVFEAGVGEGMSVWEPTIAALRTGMATFAYSRPGYGNSSSVEDLERTSEDATMLLYDTLREVGLHRPYFMVGHGIGGLYIAKYAQRYRNDVLGFVFVDARPPRYRRLCEQRGIARCDGATASNGTAVARAELAGLAASEQSAPYPRELARYQSRMLVSTDPWAGEDGAAAQDTWMDAQIQFYQRFQEARFVRVEGGGSNILRNRPQAVAGAIDGLVAHF